MNREYSKSKKLHHVCLELDICEIKQNKTYSKLVYTTIPA